MAVVENSNRRFPVSWHRLDALCIFLLVVFSSAMGALSPSGVLHPQALLVGSCSAQADLSPLLPLSPLVVAGAISVSRWYSRTRQAYAQRAARSTSAPWYLWFDVST